MTVKIGGTNRPWTKRQTTSCGTVAANVMITVGTVMANMAATISRLLPENVGQARR